MDKKDKDRRRISQAGLLDSAIRTLSQLSNSSDLATRALAIRAIAEIQQLRRLVPMRREHDQRSRIR